MQFQNILINANRSLRECCRSETRTCWSNERSTCSLSNVCTRECSLTIYVCMYIYVWLEHRMHSANVGEEKCFYKVFLKHLGWWSRSMGCLSQVISGFLMLSQVIYASTCSSVKKLHVEWRPQYHCAITIWKTLGANQNENMIE